MDTQSHPPAHRRNGSITSPGLEALAAAASEVSPLTRPAHASTPNVMNGITYEPVPTTNAIPSHNYDPSVKNDVDSPFVQPPSRNASQAQQITPSQANALDTDAGQVLVKAETNDSPMPDAPPIVGLGIEVNHSEPLLEPDTKPITSLSPHKLNGTSKGRSSSMGSPKPKAPPKKRGPPKKGTASAMKPAAKKRKLDTDSVERSPSRSTPATSGASGTPVPKGRKQSSATPTRSSSIAAEDEGDDDDDGQVFCVCRKPDDGKVMIGCDGPCEDWFHLKCMGLTEARTKLVQQWFCPNCSAQGHDTLWKRMCRLPGCNEPARQDKDGRVSSKYCCDAHGEEFFRRLLPQGHHAALTAASKTKAAGAAARKKGTGTRTPSTNGVSTPPSKPDGDLGSYDGGPRGGVLRPGELKALVDGIKEIEAFRQLGNSIPTPPKTATKGEQSPEHNAIPSADQVEYTDEERSELSDLSQKVESSQARLDLLIDRETFINMAETRRKAVLAELKEAEEKESVNGKPTVKDICGYDSRLAWADEEFAIWRSTEGGKRQLGLQQLQSPTPAPWQPPEVNGVGEGRPGAGEDDEEAEEETIGKGVCKKKRCERHRLWLKNQLAENAFEVDQVRLTMRKLEGDQQEIKDRAVVRAWEAEDMTDGVDGGNKRVNGVA